MRVARLARGGQRSPPRPSSLPAVLTLFPGLGDDFGCALAHHLGDVQRAVSLVGDGDGPIHSFRLDLQESNWA